MVKYTFENIFKNMKKRIEKHEGYSVKVITNGKSESLVVECNGEELFSHTMIGSWENADLSDLKYTRRCGLSFSRRLDAKTA